VKLPVATSREPAGTVPTSVVLMTISNQPQLRAAAHERLTDNKFDLLGRGSLT